VVARQKSSHSIHSIIHIWCYYVGDRYANSVGNLKNISLTHNIHFGYKYCISNTGEYMSDQEMSASEKKKEDWMNSKWRPMMGWMYMCVCSFDFVLAPILWSLTQSPFHGAVNVQWQPLTLQGAGLFHISMGAVLGLAAYGRTQEKLAGANNGGAVGTTYTPPAPISGTGFGGMNNATNTSGGAPAFGAPQAGGFGAPSTGFGSSSGFGAGSSGFTQTAQSAPSGFDSSGFGSAPATTASGKKIVPDLGQPLI
jgi:hypothetical protein